MRLQRKILLPKTIFLAVLVLLGGSCMSWGQESEADQAFHRASKIYEYGRSLDDKYESRSALRTAELSFRRYIDNHGGHSQRQKGYYRMAVCQLLIGKIEAAESNFEFLIKHYKKGQLVAASAYRLGAQRYNEKNYKLAQKHFRKAAQESEKIELRQQALYQQARCLMLLGNKKAAIKPLRSLVEGDRGAYQDTGRLALAHIQFELAMFTEALDNFLLLANQPEIHEDIKREARLYSGLTYGRLGDEEKALTIIAETIDAEGLKNEYKAIAQNELYSIYYKNGLFDKIAEHYRHGVYPGEPVITAGTYLTAGYAFLKKGSYPNAIQAFTSVEQLVPKSSLSFEAAYRRIYSLYQQGSPNVVSKIDEFKELYGGDQKANPWHKLLDVYRAENLYAQGEVDEAAKVYRSVDSRKLPSTAQANFLYKKVCILHESGDYNGAISAAGHFLSDHSAHDLVDEVHIRRGNAYLENSNYGSALNDFKLVLKNQPKSALAALSLQGMITVYRKERKYKELINSCSLLIEKYPSLKKMAKAHAYYWKGWGYFKQEDFASAIEPLEKAKFIAPKYYNEPAGIRLFLSSYYLQDADKMKETYQRLKAEVPGKYIPPRILAWLGIQRYQKKDYITAAEVLEQLINEEDPLETPLDVWRYYTKSKLEYKQYEQALSAVEHVIKREEKDFWKADALLDKAQALVNLQKYEEAIVAANQGLYYKPKGTIDASLRMLIAKANHLNGDPDQAKNDYLLIADKFKIDDTIRPLALWKAAQVMKSQGNSTAKAMFTSIKEEYPNWKAPSN